MTTARLSVPVSISQTNATRLVAPQATVLTTGARISTVPVTQQASVIGTTAARLVSTTQPNVSLGRLAVTVANTTQGTNANILGQTRISLHSVVALPNNSQTRNIQAQGAKVISQSVQGKSYFLLLMFK